VSASIHKIAIGFFLSGGNTRRLSQENKDCVFMLDSKA
jgi:hypothetical protein